ncbi:RNA helicase [Plakobranchus ocellatus]|uniref:RNA helicase n=1 Tax=Plakobranchus ocellatus TaxID=259542 RepID=A0AAV4D1P4_9GAST|nr:RNA helicase [Plakobranchus ocellatus]
MATIKCPAPGCDAEWPLATPTDVLTRLLDIHSATAHAASTHVHAPTAAKAEKVRRPTITASGTSEEWAYFLRRWADYKQATRLAGSDIVFQLLECCDEGCLWYTVESLAIEKLDELQRIALLPYNVTSCYHLVSGL